MRPSALSPIGPIRKSYAWLPTIGQATEECIHSRYQCGHPLTYKRSTDWAGGSWHSSALTLKKSIIYTQMKIFDPRTHRFTLL